MPNLTPGIPIDFTCVPYTPGYTDADHTCTWTWDDADIPQVGLMAIITNTSVYSVGIVSPFDKIISISAFPPIIPPGLTKILYESSACSHPARPTTGVVWPRKAP